MTEASNEPTAQPYTPPKKRKLVLPITLGILAIAVIGFVASRAGLDKALVKQKLDAFIVQMKENGKAQGRDLDLTYGDLKVVGSFSSKHVVIENPSFTVKPLEGAVTTPDAGKTNSLIITSPTLEIYPEAVDMSALRIQFPEAINVAGLEAPDKSLLKITANTPLAVSVAQSTVNDVPRAKVHYESPTELNLTYLREQQAEGTEDATPTVVPVYETMNIAFAPGSGLDTDFTSDGTELGEGKLDLSSIVMTPASNPGGMVKIEKIKAIWSNALSEKKLNKLDVNVAFGPVTADAELLPYSPVALAMEGSYEGAMPKTPEAVAAIESQESALVIKTFSLSSKDSTLSATANFTATPTDALPVGTANVTLTNVPFVLGELRKLAILSPDTEALVDVIVTRMTGKKLVETTDLNVPVERARGGAFKVGQTTFEELFAAVLQHAMKGAVPEAPPAVKEEHAPKLPAPDKPKAKAQPLHDPSVRG